MAEFASLDENNGPILVVSETSNALNNFNSTRNAVRVPRKIESDFTVSVLGNKKTNSQRRFVTSSNISVSPPKQN